MRVHGPSESAASAKAAPPRYAHTCAGCGTAYASPVKTARFCGNRCRFEFDNRRKQRGAILYDLFMAMRFDRATAKEQGLWAIMCRAASEWRAEDAEARDGRPSWHTPKSALSRLTHLFATTLVKGRK